MTSRVNKPQGQEKRERLRVVVSGKVHGVGFRQATWREAERLGLHGWVRNRPEGTVEIDAIGTTPQLEALLQWCHRGPALARVTDVAVVERAPFDDDGNGGFEILP